MYQLSACRFSKDVAYLTGMFIAARGINGFGLALNITAATLLIMELAYPSQRAPMVSI